MIWNARHSKNASSNDSLGDYLYDKYEEKVKKEMPEILNDLESRKIFFGIFNWRFVKKCSIQFLLFYVTENNLKFFFRCRAENLYNGCDTVYDLSLKNSENFVEIDGFKTIQIEKGYKIIIDELISPHREAFFSKLKLKHVLENILLCTSLANDGLENKSDCEHCKYTQDKTKLALKIRDLESKSEIIVVCENVICTMSLGVLKENFEKIVKPASLIPKEKLETISRLGFGIVNKVKIILNR